MKIRKVLDLFVVLILISSLLLTPVAAVAQGPDQSALTAQMADDELKAKEKAGWAALEAAAALRPAPVSGSGVTALILTEDFETWPPPNWTIVNNGGDCVWESTATTGRPNYAGGDGQAADADSDNCGLSTTMDTELRTPALDLTPYGGATLEFIASYNDLSTGGDTFAVDISSDGGASWTNVLFWDEDHDANGPGELVSINLSPYASNNVVVRFHYYGAAYDWWAEVDQVRIFSPMPKLSMSYKEASGSIVTPGDLLTYTVVISNSGNLSATHTTLLDPIPANIQFARLVAPPAASYNAGQNRVEWSGAVTASESVSVTFVVTTSTSIACGVPITNTATISDTDIPAPVQVQVRTDTFLDQLFFFEDFEGDNGGFTASGANASWEWGNVGPYGGTRDDWPASAYSGSKAWGTNLTGDYNLNEEAYLTSPAIDLSGAVNISGIPLYLSWGQWMYNESAIFDWGEVEVRGGSTGWTLLDPPGRMGGAQDTDWASYLVDISAFAGSSDFQVRFHFHSDSSVVYPGWYVDALSIQQCAPPPGLYLSPDDLAVSGCVGTPQRHNLNLSNWTGSDGTFALSYSLTKASWGTIEGPASLSLVSEMEASLAITITPELCLPDGLQLLASVEASGNGYTDTTYITKTVITGGSCPTCTDVGWLEGHVYDYDAVGAPCTDAVVHVEPGNLDVAVDATGYYTVALVPFDYDVTASAADYPALDGPYSLTISDSMTVTRDFELDRPDVEVDPLALTAEAVNPGSVTRTLTISNNGTSELEWEIREIAPTTVLNAMSAAANADDGSAKSRALEDASGIEVEPQLLTQITANESTGYLIYLREKPDLSPALGMDWLERGRFVTKALQETARTSQARLRTYLDAQGTEYQTFWIDNIILVKNSNRVAFDGLLQFSEIEALRARRMMQVIEPVGRSDPAALLAIEPNISHVHADQVWGQGILGQGMVVANIDTGVRYTHEVLEPHYRGNLGGGSFDHDYNWLGPADGDSIPTDDHGHGSHTMGTMIGDDGGTNQVGMAPGAQWIACDGCSASGGCPDTALLTCAQWVAAPYPIGDPGSPDPDKRPSVVNNSWGDCATSYDNWYQGVVDGWHAAGVYPVFSNGNASNCSYPEPPGCNTVGNPARYGNVTGVGSTGQSNGQYATHSNWGPTDNPDTVNPNGYPSLKPQVLAPGVNIRSSLNGSDSDYASWGGTSMSSPHVSGLIALMWSAAPCLVGDYAATETILEETAMPLPYDSGCGGEGPGNQPNMATGWGEIDAYAAVEGARDYCGADWLEWVSTDPITGTIGSGGEQMVDVAFTCTTTATQQTQPLQGTLRILSNDPCQDAVDVDLTFYCISQAPIPNWEKTVEINGQVATPVAGPHIVRPGDTVVVVDLVGATYSETITSVLTETWSASLELVGYDTNGVGVVTEGDHELRWDLVGVAQNTLHPITKTFEVLYGAWTTDYITESYHVEGAADQPAEVVVVLEHHVPALTLDKTGPATAGDGATIPLTLTISSDGNFRGTARLTDTLPTGMTYAGNLTASYGEAHEAANVIYWTSYTTTMNLVDAPTQIAVGILSPDSDALQDLVDLINGMAGLTAARIPGDLSAMTLADLQPYHLIVVSNNEKWSVAGGNPNIGNILADYVDGGGKIIMADFAWDNVGWELTGRVMAEGYTAYQTATGDLGNTDLGSYDNSHPVMAGVTAMSLAGTVTHQALPLETGATWIADWADGAPCVYAQGADVLGLNFLLDWTDPGWPWTGDVPTLLENSINWLMSQAQPPMPATVTITFDVEVTGSPNDVIRNTATLDWGTDWTDAIHDTTLVEGRFFYYLPLIYKGD